MAMNDSYSQNGGYASGTDGTPAQPWWQGPPPPGYTGPWPPALPDGASYDPNTFGGILYGSGGYQAPGGGYPGQVTAPAPAANTDDAGNSDPTTPPPAPTQDPGTGLVPPDGTYGVAPPTYQAPDPLKLPTYTTPDPYKPTTAGDILNDPSYGFRFDQGMKAVQADRAASGIYNGAGTAQALLNYGQNAASQEYKDIDDRRRQDYATNYTTQTLDPYNNAYKTAQDTATYGQTQANTQYQDAYQNWLQQYQNWRNSRTDAFNQKYLVAST